MLSEFLTRLDSWGTLDNRIVITAMLAAMACALPGCFLLLRRQSMMGDALSHSALLGIVLAVVFAHWLWTTWIASLPAGLQYRSLQNTLVFGGAVAIGILTAWLTEEIRTLGRVEASAALGVVFTSLFALGLLLIPLLIPSSVHVDVDCVLMGKLETAALPSYKLGPLAIPHAAVFLGAILLANLLLIVLFFKELRISAFDPSLATTLGVSARGMHYALMAATAVTVVAAFESVGSILVIAMLITPAATARLLSDRLSTIIVLSLVIAAAAAALGHALAIGLPALLFRRLGYPEVGSASTSGMMTLAIGLLFVLAMLFSPRHGAVSKVFSRLWLGLRIASEDLLGVLYRLEESGYVGDPRHSPRWMHHARLLGRVRTFLAVLLLKWSGKIVASADGYRLTDAGGTDAKRLIRSHRLWEGYLAKHFDLPDDHLHEAAERVEHFVSPELRDELTAELDDADVDPHGRAIPPESARGQR